MQKLLRLFSTKNIGIFQINIWNFNKMVTNEVFSFEQLGPDFIVAYLLYLGW